MAARLGQQMGLPEPVLSDLFLAGLLHDIGTIGLRETVLQKPGRLTIEEMAHIQEHPVIGDQLLADLRPLQHLRPGVRHHHERHDGKGYPDGLAGEQIPLLARILAVAEACDAMLSNRPYRPALTPANVETALVEGAGTQWDPEVVAYFLACRHDVFALARRPAAEPANSNGAYAGGVSVASAEAPTVVLRGANGPRRSGRPGGQA
jgi:HD-GYP domain-containing protein (c-di-GMP phosphodiesterase class II)